LFSSLKEERTERFAPWCRPALRSPSNKRVLCARYVDRLTCESTPHRQAKQRGAADEDLRARRQLYRALPAARRSRQARPACLHWTAIPRCCAWPPSARERRLRAKRRLAPPPDTAPIPSAGSGDLATRPESVLPLPLDRAPWYRDSNRLTAAPRPQDRSGALPSAAPGPGPVRSAPGLEPELVVSTKSRSLHVCSNR